MPNLENHMDELLRRAADNYPLKTRPVNFDDLVPFIETKTAETANPFAAAGKRKIALILLAFLITALTTGTYLIKIKTGNNTISSRELVQQKTDDTPKNKNVQKINTEPSVADQINTEPENSLPGTENFAQKNKLNSFQKARFITVIVQGIAVTDEVTTTDDQVQHVEIAVNKPAAAITSTQELNSNNITPEPKKEIIKTPEQKNEQVTEAAIPTGKNDKKKKNKPSVYYGVTAGVELNQVKNQGMTRAGANGGILAGLQINKKISVETGVQLSQKKYYSQGKYFNPKTGSMPNNMTVNSLEGTSTLIEIPVAVKYNFTKKKNTLYGKAGVSSYIMTKESNKYQAVVSGQQQEINSTYKNTQGYWASEVRISAGYQHSLIKKLNIRVEPYIQIPLKGIGIGALPVTSTGLQLVLTRN